MAIVAEVKGVAELPRTSGEVVLKTSCWSTPSETFSEPGDKVSLSANWRLLLLAVDKRLAVVRILAVEVAVGSASNKETEERRVLVGVFSSVLANTTSM